MLYLLAQRGGEHASICANLHFFSFCSHHPSNNIICYRLKVMKANELRAASAPTAKFHILSFIHYLIAQPLARKCITQQYTTLKKSLI